ncbi:hypothetical protein GH714_003143 [Hevea brasiliensis]|uniref:Tubby C-terminal domain-containing protein n=1 Tax=Hevea brasiliensis TaxID=3981 RepID=A0A6A6LYA5_HEVBR|nr:hypothetical protein GH714_003143 [Hevea brasiliensis]
MPASSTFSSRLSFHQLPQFDTYSGKINIKEQPQPNSGDDKLSATGETVGGDRATVPGTVSGGPHCCQQALDSWRKQFTVTDVNGTLFQVKSKLLSIHDRRFLQDAAGNTLVTLRQKIMTAHRRWEVFRGESTDTKDLLFSAKKSSILQFKTELDVFLGSNTSEDVPDFKVKGTWKERSCTIYLGLSNTIVAQMHRRHTLKTALLEADNFAVTVYPNVDYAFIVALVVVLDEINNDRSGED